MFELATEGLIKGRWEKKPTEGTKAPRQDPGLQQGQRTGDAKEQQEGLWGWQSRATVSNEGEQSSQGLCLGPWREVARV